MGYLEGPRLPPVLFSVQDYSYHQIPSAVNAVDCKKGTPDLRVILIASWNNIADLPNE